MATSSIALLVSACSVDGGGYHVSAGGSLSDAPGGASAGPSSLGGGPESPSEGEGGDASSATPSGGTDSGSAPSTAGRANGGENAEVSNSAGGGTGGLASNGEGGAPTAGASDVPSSGSSGDPPEDENGCDRELLENGDFEAGRKVWSETWDGGDPFQIIVPRNHARLSAAGVSPRDGNYLAWLGGIPDDEWDSHNTVLSQPVQIPADAAVLTLKGYIWVRSLETPETKADYAVIELADEEGNIPWQIQLWNRDHATSDWVYFEKSSNELDLVRGQTLTFVAQARTDLTEESSFWLDSLSFVASCR